MLKGSLLPALLANPQLKCLGVDICVQVAPSGARVDIYVPAAFRWLVDNKFHVARARA